jgi:multidrug efflux system membrane fusion protein
MPIEPPLGRDRQAAVLTPLPRRRRRWPWLVLFLLLAAGGAAWWYWPQLTGQGATPTAPARPGGRGGRVQGAVPVTAAAAARADIPVLVDALGTVQALNSITIRSQVDGVLVEIAFTEGQEVRAGDVLARIDPRTYAAALAQAEAKRAQDMALLANARLDLQRYADLARSNGATRQQLDTQRALVAQYEAQVQADEAAIDNARTQLDFTTIRSPIDGRVGIRAIDRGNLIRSGDSNGIVLVNQVAPISVLFTLPQQELPRVITAMQSGPVVVQALANDGSVRATGTLLTPDNTVDQTTGTIRLKATFGNEDRMLWPGAFINVRIQLGTLRQVLTVPLAAVQRGPDGPYAFVVRADSTVEQRPLGLGLITAREAVVTRGLHPGERVVTSGGLRLNNGSEVNVTEPVRAAPVAAPPVGEGRRRGPRPEGSPGQGSPGQGAPGQPAPAASAVPAPQ